MSANLFPAKRMTPQQVGLLSAAIPSPFGDALGLLADAAGYAQDPSSLTPGRGLLSLAALAPGIPRVYRGSKLGGPAPEFGVRFFTPDKKYASKFGGMIEEAPIPSGKGLDLSSLGDAADDGPLMDILEASLPKEDVAKVIYKLKSRADGKIPIWSLMRQPETFDAMRKNGYDYVKFSQADADGAVQTAFGLLDK